MSWQAYVDDHLLCGLQHGGQLSHAAIIGLDGGVWAQSANFPAITEDEISKLAKGFDDFSGFAANGVFVGGVKYMFITSDLGSVIRGRGKENKQSGLTAKKTTSAIVMGIYDEGVQAADCNDVVEGLGDYLVGQGI